MTDDISTISICICHRRQITKSPYIIIRLEYKDNLCSWNTKITYVLGLQPQINHRAQMPVWATANRLQVIRNLPMEVNRRSLPFTPFYHHSQGWVIVLSDFVILWLDKQFLAAFDAFHVNLYHIHVYLIAQKIHCTIICTSPADTIQRHSTLPLYVIDKMAAAAIVFTHPGVKKNPIPP